MAGSSHNWENKVICWKTEVTEGTDPTPVAPTDALKVLNFRPTFMTADKKVRNIEKGFFGANPVALTALKRGASFDMEIHGGGAATTVPPWMKVLRASGFDAGVVTGGIKVVQTPITNGIPSATMWTYLDDLLMKAIGGRAAVGFKIEDDEYPLFNITYLGRAPTTLIEQAAPASITPPSGYITPVLASSENTTFTWDGYAVGLRRWEMNSNSDNQYRSLINIADRINYRNRDWNGTLLIQIPDLTTKDYFLGIRSGATAVAQAVHGTVAGNIVQVDCPALQITGDVEISEEAGNCMASFPVTALPVTGNDEIVFTSK
jgi:hypothetical protein